MRSIVKNRKDERIIEKGRKDKKKGKDKKLLDVEIGGKKKRREGKREKIVLRKDENEKEREWLRKVKKMKNKVIGLEIVEEMEKKIYVLMWVEVLKKIGE